MRSVSRWVFVLLAFSVFGCDHATKFAASSRLAGGAMRELVPGVLDLRRAENTDSAFGLLGWLIPRDARWALLVSFQLAGAIAIAAVAALFWKRTSTLERIAGALLLGGALGNALDRAFRGYVVDFIHLHYWPTFNVADIAITVGVGLLLLASSARYRASA